MLVFIAVISGVIAGVAAGSLTPLLVLRAREQRVGGLEPASVPDDPRATGVDPSEETLDAWAPPDHASFVASPSGTTPARPPVPPDLDPPLPGPDGPVPPPSWARAERPEPKAAARIWATPEIEEVGIGHDATDQQPTTSEPVQPQPVRPSHGDPHERRTEPLGTDLWEGWGSQGSLDELWQLEETRPPAPVAFLGILRRGRDAVVETGRRTAALAKERFSDRGSSEIRDGLGGTLRGLWARVQRLPRERLAVAGIVGVVLIAAVVLGILASGPSDEVVHVTVDREAQPSSEPYLIQVDVPATPAPSPESRTPESEPSAVAAPAEPAPAETAPTPAPSSGPDASTDVSCSTEGLHVDFSLSASGTDLQWFTLYVDGEAVSGGPLSGTEHSDTYTGAGEPGDHDVELVGTDEAGARSVDRSQTNCPASA